MRTATYTSTSLVAMVVAWLGLTPADAQQRPAKSPADWATRAGLTLEQMSAPSALGYPVRVLTSRPASARGRRLPAIVFIPWLSCDPVEVADSTDDGYIRLVRDLSVHSGMLVARVEKPGVAGSAGPDCAVSALEDDLAAFRAGIAAVRARADVDSARVFLVGGSIGGALAVALATEAEGGVAGLVSVNSFAETWYEHMLGFERRRLTLGDTSRTRLGPAMRGFELLYTEYLIGKHTPGDVIAAHPELRAIWYDTTTGQYGRSAAYFQQVQALDIDRALAALDVPALFLGGEYDWIMGADEPMKAAARVNRFHPGRANARVYPRLGHDIRVCESALAALHGRGGRYEGQVARDVARWLRQAAGRPGLSISPRSVRLMDGKSRQGSPASRSGAAESVPWPRPTLRARRMHNETALLADDDVARWLHGEPGWWHGLVRHR